MQSKLKSNAWNNYKKAPLTFYILGITTGILIAAILALDLVVPFLSIFLFPLLCLPILFSAMLQHVMLQKMDRITVSTSFKMFGLYFTRSFSGSFSYLMSLVKTLIIFVGIQGIVSFSSSLILLLTNGSFTLAIQDFSQILADEEATFEKIQEVLYSYDGLLMHYMIYTFLPPYILSLLFLIYLLSRNSLTIYYSLHSKNLNPYFARAIVRMVIRKRRWQMVGRQFILNWPFFLLILLGLAGGAVLGYFWQGDLLTMIATANIGGALLASFYLPFYLSNQEAFYDSYIHDMRIATTAFGESLIKSSEGNPFISPEEKQQMEERFKKDFDEPLDNKEEENDKE